MASTAGVSARLRAVIGAMINRLRATWWAAYCPSEYLRFALISSLIRFRM
jgi:hypothetical protein